MSTEGNSRVYSRVSIPVELFMDGQGYKVLDWSLGGLSIMGAPRLPEGAIVAGFLRVAQKGVDVSIKVRLEVIYARPPDRMGLAFHQILPEQLSVLRTLILGHGLPPLARLEPPPELGAGSLSGDGETRNEPAAKPPGRRLKRPRLSKRLPAAAWFFTAVIVVVTGLALLRFTCVPDDSVAAAVAAPAAGIINSHAGYVDRIFAQPGAAVTVGQPILSLRNRAEPTDVVVIDSPCDCIISTLLVKVGMELVPEQTVGYAVEQEAEARFVEALFETDLKPRTGESVSVFLADGATGFAGRTIAATDSPEAQPLFGLPAHLKRDSRFAHAVIALERAVGPEQVGSPVRVQLTDPERYGSLCALWHEVQAKARRLGAGG